MYTLYFSPGSCSLIVNCLLHELEVPFELKRVDVAGGSWQQITVELPANGDHFVYLEVAEPSPDRMAWSAPIWITKI